MVAVAAMTTLTVAATSAAAEPRSGSTVSIGYADLDLSTRAGVATLYRRIVGASRRVCRTLPRATHALQQAVRECREAAVEGAVAQVHNAQLAAVHAEQQRRS
jgi:UrcA family protein